MYAYITATAKALEPFGEHPRDCLVGNQPLHRVQDQALRGLGFKPLRVDDVASVRDPEPHLVLEDRLYFTVELIADFVVQSRARKASTRCAIQQGPITEHTAAATQGVPLVNGAYVHELRYEPEAAARGVPTLVVIDPEQNYQPLPIARHMTPAREPRLPISDRMMIRIDHWVNLWAANLAGLIAERARLKRGSWR
jgi:hypothetical protein